MRFFNTAGPCVPGRHYMLDAARRLDAVRPWVEAQDWFVLHAPRQTGKTTSIIQLARQLTAEGRYAAAMVTAEVGQGMANDRFEAAVLSSWRGVLDDSLPAELRPPPWPAAEQGDRIAAALRAWAAVCPRPIVLFIDEIDALHDENLISVLRQLRSGFPQRPGGFPSTVGLVGLRDVRDYVVASGGSGRLGTASPFNVKAESITLPSFSRGEVDELLDQHTVETGQAFVPEAKDELWRQSVGQPWLVNALARQLTTVFVVDRATPIGRADVVRASDELVRRMDTHLDSLAYKLEKPRVKAALEPMITGHGRLSLRLEDKRYLLDLGLLREEDGQLVVANPIYAQIIARTVSDGLRGDISVMTAPVWLTADRRLDVPALLDAFVSFWRQHADVLLGDAPWHEAAAQLVLMAFLDRVANGGGRVEREYALGRGRLDLLLQVGAVRVAMELKVWRDGAPDPLAQGLEQLDRYLAQLGEDRGWLLIFDQRTSAPPARDRTTVGDTVTPGGRAVVLLRI